MVMKGEGIEKVRGSGLEERRAERGQRRLILERKEARLEDEESRKL